MDRLSYVLSERPASLTLSGVTTSGVQPSNVPVRPSDVLSTYAVGAFAGQVAGFAWLFPLVIIGWHPDDSPELLALAALSPFAGLLYVELMSWLPDRLRWRMAVFGIVTAASVGVLAGAVAEPTAQWRSHLLALAIGVSTPLAARGVVWAFVRSAASVTALRPGQSIPLLFLVAVFIVIASGSLAEVARASPALTVVYAVSLVGLGLAIWTVGLRPADERPRWFRPYGLSVTALLVTVGILSAWI